MCVVQNDHEKVRPASLCANPDLLKFSMNFVCCFRSSSLVSFRKVSHPGPGRAKAEQRREAGGAALVQTMMSAGARSRQPLPLGCTFVHPAGKTLSVAKLLEHYEAATNSSGYGIYL